MKRTLIIALLCILTVSTLLAQSSCEEILRSVKSDGRRQASYCCFKSEFLTGVDFYSLDIDDQMYYFAIVQFRYGKWYIYQVPKSTNSNFSFYAFGDQAGEAFHKFIHAYRNSLGCAPEFE